MYINYSFHSWYTDIDPVIVRLRVLETKNLKVEGHKDPQECYITLFDDPNSEAIIKDAWRNDKQELTEWLTEPSTIVIKNNKDILPL